MRILLVAALVMLVLAALVAMGNSIVTNWNVWLCWGLVAYVLDQVSDGKVRIG